MKQKFFVTLPNGQVETRQSAHDYKFVVIGLFPETAFHRRTYGTTWAAFTWSASHENAQKAANQLHKWCESDRPSKIQVVPVEGVL